MLNFDVDSNALCELVRNTWYTLYFAELRQHTPEGHLLDATGGICASGDDVNMVHERSKETALHTTSRVGDIQAMKTLLDRGADINALSFSKNTPLYMACYYSQEEAAEFLILQGCDINQQDVTHRSPLMLTIERGMMSLMQTLLNDPTCDVTQFDRRKRNILHHAVIARNVDAIKILQRKKLMKYLSGQPDRLGVFPISIAARKGYLDVVAALLATGADPDIREERFLS